MGSGVGVGVGTGVGVGVGVGVGAGVAVGADVGVGVAVGADVGVGVKAEVSAGDTLPCAVLLSDAVSGIELWHAESRPNRISPAVNRTIRCFMPHLLCQRLYNIVSLFVIGSNPFRMILRSKQLSSKQLKCSDNCPELLLVTLIPHTRSAL